MSDRLTEVYAEQLRKQYPHAHVFTSGDICVLAEIVPKSEVEEERAKFLSKQRAKFLRRKTKRAK